MEKRGGRIWELDFLRGIALFLMIYFHTIYDMKEFFHYPVNYEGNVNYYIGKAAAILFILLSGISSSLTRSNVKRSLKTLGAALLVTLASYFYNPGFVIVFGILHFLGLSALLSHFFKKLNPFLLFLLGTAIMASDTLISKVRVTHNFLMPFNITSPGFVSSDYYPLIPWLGLFLFGIALGKLLYTEKKSLLNFSPKCSVICTAGRHTLPIYLLHQPAIVLILMLIQFLR